MDIQVGQRVIVHPSFNDVYYRGLTPVETTVERVGHSYFYVAGIYGKFRLNDGIQKVRPSGSPRRCTPANPDE